MMNENETANSDLTGSDRRAEEVRARIATLPPLPPLTTAEQWRRNQLVEEFTGAE